MLLKKRVIYYLVDGARPDSMQQLLFESKLPNIQKIVEEGTFRKATTFFHRYYYDWSTK